MTILTILDLSSTCDRAILSSLPTGAARHRSTSLASAAHTRPSGPLHVSTDLARLRSTPAAIRPGGDETLPGDEPLRVWALVPGRYTQLVPEYHRLLRTVDRHSANVCGS